jgi:cytochrome c oxidase subunit 2
LGGHRPELLAVIRAVGGEITSGVTLHDEIPGGGQHAAVPWSEVVDALVIVVTGITHALHPPSNVEPTDPVTLHLQGEFVESNLGTALELDGVTVRLIAQQYSFVPNCVKVPADTPVKFRLTSADVIHGFILVDTNVNTMVVPGFVSEVRTSFAIPDDYRMPCDEFCGLGHQGMWARVVVVPIEQFPRLTPEQRTSCVSE